MSKNNFKTVEPKKWKGKKKTVQKIEEESTTFLQEISDNKLCIYDLAGGCKKQCNGKQNHPTVQEFASLRIFQKVMKTPWSLGEWKTPLDEISKQIKAEAYTDVPNIRPFVRTCLYAAMGQDHCENWKKHRLVEIKVQFNQEIVKIYACYTKPMEWVDKKTHREETRAFCGLHFDFTVLPQGKSYRFLKLLQTELPPPTQKELAEQKEVQDKKDALSPASFPVMDNNIHENISRIDSNSAWSQSKTTEQSEEHIHIDIDSIKDIAINDINLELEAYVHESKKYNDLLSEYIDLSNKHGKLLEDYQEMKIEAEDWRKEADNYKFKYYYVINPPPNASILMRDFDKNQKTKVHQHTFSSYFTDDYSPEYSSEHSEEHSEEHSDGEYEY